MTEPLFAEINGRSVAFQEGETILEVCRREGIFVPTLCEFAALNHRPGTCRMCLVETTEPADSPFAPAQTPRLSTACDTRLTPGLSVNTLSKRVRDARKRQAKLLFADHCETCSGCPRHGQCELQQTARQVGLTESELSRRECTRTDRIDETVSLRFTADKCIRCLRCVEVCRQVHGIGAITFENVGTDASVGFDGQHWAWSSRCISCGQCTLVCPTGALDVVDETDKAIDLLADPSTVVAVQFAPAVRLTLAEALGRPAGENLEGRIVAALKRMGADYVCDTRWSADVTIMEEGTELIERLEAQRRKGSLDRPDTMFTSCCPGWVNHVEKTCPDLLPHISSTRSPQAIFSSLAKTYLPKMLDLDARRIRVISIMPCTAKKDEAARPKLSPSTDLVLTVRELARLLERFGIRLDDIEPQSFDSPFMTQTSGGGQLFATTGGVMESALRTVSALTGGRLDAMKPFEPMRGLDNIKEAVLETQAFGPIRVAVVYGIRAADKLVELVRRGESPYHFVEVMACPGGCIGGGGTAQGRWRSTLPIRQAAVYQIDRNLPIRAAHQNPDVVRLYEKFLEKPCSPKAHELLHTSYDNRCFGAVKPTFREINAALKLVD